MRLSENNLSSLLDRIGRDASDTSYLLMAGFQRIKYPTAIPLKSLTLAFGPNSSGKSSIADALKLIQTTWEESGNSESESELVSRWQRFDKTDAHDLSVGVSILTSVPELILYTPLSLYPGAEPDWYREINKKLRAREADSPQIRLTWIASWDVFKARSLKVYVGSKELAKLEGWIDEGGTQPPELSFSVSAPEFKLVFGQTLRELLPEFYSGRTKLSCEFELEDFDWPLSRLVPAVDYRFTGQVSSNQLALVSLLFSGPLAVIDGMRCGLAFTHVGPSRSIPTGRALSFLIAKNREPFMLVPDSRSANQSIDREWNDLARLFASVQGEQSVPKTTANEPTSRTNRSTFQISKINEWLQDQTYLSMPCKITAKITEIIGLPTRFDGRTRKPARSDSFDSGQFVILQLQDSEGRMFNLEDVGTGFSQVIPVLVSCVMRTGLVVLEQPELHLHPALQTRLCDVLLDAREMPHLDRMHRDERWSSVIVESHSEHMVLRLLRRIRETSKGKIANRGLEVKPNDVAILYFLPDGDHTLVQQIRVGEDGTFLDRWPQGFFDERFAEIEGIFEDERADRS